jgi:hypothetical protein
LRDAVLFAWALLFFNVFGQVTAVERYGYELFNQLFAPASQSVFGYGAGAQDKTAVVLYRDKDLQGKSWPPAYGEHARHLSRVRAGEPLALMIDFVFVDPRPDPTIRELRKELMAFEAAGIKVFLASPHEESAKAPKIRKELEGAFATPVPVPGLVGSASGIGYPLFVLAHEGKRKPTAAPALYGALCNGDDRKGTGHFCEPRTAAAQVLPLDEAAWTLELFWGMSYPESLSHVACRSIPGFLGRLWTIIWSHGEGLRVDCAFTPTVTIEDLTSTEDPKELKKLFKGKAVFYGANFLAGSDIIFPPTHYSLPGVYSHAMALDNLLTFGTSYKREAIPNPLPLVPRWLKAPMHRLVSELDDLIQRPQWFPGQGRLASFVRCFGEELTPHCVQYPLLALVLLYLHVVSNVGACLVDVKRLAAIPRRGARVLLLALSAAWTITLTIVAPLFLVLWFALKVEFEWLNLTAGNWLEALLEAWAGHQWGPPLMAFVLTLINPRPSDTDHGGKGG